MMCCKSHQISCNQMRSKCSKHDCMSQHAKDPSTHVMTWSAHLLVVTTIEDARQASNAYTTKLDHPSMP